MSVTRVLPCSPARRAEPRPHVLAGLHRRRNRRERLLYRLRRLLVSRVRGADDFVGRQRPVSLARAHVHVAPLQPHRDLVELAVGRRLRRVVAEQVVEARVAHDLREARRQVVAIDDRAAVGLLRQRPQRVLRHLQRARVLVRPDRLIDAELEGRQPAGIDRIDRGVVAVGRGEDVAQLGVQIRLAEEGGGLFPLAVLARHRDVRPTVPSRPDRRVGRPQLRRQHRREPLADVDDRLASFAQAAETCRQASQRAHDDLVADLLDDLRRRARVLLLERVARLVVELAPLELFDRADDRRVIAREGDPVHAASADT